MRKAKVYLYNELAVFLTGSLARPVSLTLPLQDKPHACKTMIPFLMA